MMKGYSWHNFSLIGRKQRAKFENDRILRNGHTIKIAQPNVILLVLFSSAEDVWSNDVNKYNTFRSQGTETPPFRFFWDTRYTLYIPNPCSRFDRGNVFPLTHILFTRAWALLSSISLRVIARRSIATHIKHKQTRDRKLNITIITKFILLSRGLDFMFY